MRFENNQRVRELSVDQLNRIPIGRLWPLLWYIWWSIHLLFLLCLSCIFYRTGIFRSNVNILDNWPSNSLSILTDCKSLIEMLPTSQHITWQTLILNVGIQTLFIPFYSGTHLHLNK